MDPDDTFKQNRLIKTIDNINNQIHVESNLRKTPCSFRDRKIVNKTITITKDADSQEVVQWTTYYESGKQNKTTKFSSLGCF